jgi:hypothetical protein
MTEQDIKRLVPTATKVAEIGSHEVITLIVKMI